MGNLARKLNEVKGNAMRAAHEQTEDPARLAAYRLLTAGDHSHEGIDYGLSHSGPKGARQWDGHRWTPQGNAYHRSTLVSDVLAWLLKPIDRVVVWERLLEGSRRGEKATRFYARAECPLGCGDAERTKDGDVHNWNACEHFVQETVDGAVFMAYFEEARTCSACDRPTPDAPDTCVHCGHDCRADGE